MKYLLFLLLFLTSCTLNQVIADPPSDGGSLKTKLGASFHWDPRLFPLPVRVDSTLDPAVKSALYVAIHQWNLEVGHAVFFYEEVSPTHDAFWEPGQYGVVSVTVEELGIGFRGLPMLGRTRIYLSRNGQVTGSAASAIVHLSPNIPQDKLYFVLLHELGHVLCLEHDHDKMSVMFPTTEYNGSLIQEADLEYVRHQVRGEVANLYTISD